MPPNRNRGKYLGFVAHEIKNPLATALWSCDLLKRMEGPDRTGDRADKMLDVSLRALRRMRRLIDDFFTIERLLEHGYDLKHERVSLAEVVEHAIQTLRDKDGILTEGWTVQVDQVAARGDAEMLRRCVRALIEHMARGAPKPKLAIVAAKSSGVTTLQVNAETPPSPLVPPLPEERPSGDPVGAVLGFALAEQIIEMHAGKLEERDGGLRISLPAAD